MSLRRSERLAQLKALCAEYEADPAFAALRASATQLVPGFGPTNARILLVGEAPGAEEDRRGIPFVGAAGRVLDSLLACAELARDEVYVTNLVKYRPPDNRDPTPGETIAASPYLWRELRIVGAPFVVALGRHAARACLGEPVSLGEVHGRMFSMEHGRGGAFTCVTMYHPAAALYQRDLRAVMEQDYARMGRALRKRG